MGKHGPTKKLKLGPMVWPHEGQIEGGQPEWTGGQPEKTARPR